MEQEEGEAQETEDDELEEINAARTTDGFKYNPGKTGEIFATEGEAQHPYFSVPKAYEKLAENNFNLSIPDEE